MDIEAVLRRAEVDPGSDRAKELLALQERKEAWIEEMTDLSGYPEEDIVLNGAELVKYIGEQLMTDAIIPGLSRFHMSYSEFSNGDADMVRHTRSYLEGLESGYCSGYSDGYTAALEKVRTVGIRKRQRITGEGKARKDFMDEQKTWLGSFEPFFFTDIEAALRLGNDE